MWVIAMFDLPTDSQPARRAYTRFRKDLLEDGFSMMQYSIYIRHCASIENAEVHVTLHVRMRAGQRRGKISHHHRQPVRTNQDLLGEKTVSSPPGTRPTSAFLKMGGRFSLFNQRLPTGPF